MVQKDLSPKQKITELLKASRKIAVVISGARAENDYAALGYARVLSQSGRDVAIVCMDGRYPDSIKADVFLNTLPVQSFGDTSGYHIAVRPKSARLTSLRYDHVPGGIDIIVEAQGDVSVPEVVVTPSRGNYDAIVCLGLDAYSLAKAHVRENSPLIYISAQEERISDEGVLQFSDSSASCVGEILVAFSESIYKEGIDADVATGYYASMVLATDRFQNNLTSPKALTVAAQLLALGARRLEILKSLFGYQAHMVEPVVAQSVVPIKAVYATGPQPTKLQDERPQVFSEDELYAPQVKDLLSDQPQIVDDPKTGLLAKLMTEKKKSQEDIDFLAMEDGLRVVNSKTRGDFDEIG